MEEREYNFIMDPNRGKKWFVFYTKIRPWLSVVSGVGQIICLAVVLLLPGSFDYPTLLAVSYASGAANAVFQLLVFIKSFGDYFDFVKYVRIALIAEASSILVSSIVNSITSGDDAIVTIVISVFAAGLGYLWYRVNYKYFDRRLVCTNPPTDDERYIYELERLGLVSQSEKKPETVEQLLNEYGITVTYDESANDAGECEKNKKANYCRKCGTKLQEDAIFCSNCGTKAN